MTVPLRATMALHLGRVGFRVAVFLPGCRAIGPDTAESACRAMRDAGIVLCQDLEQLDAALVDAAGEN